MANKDDTKQDEKKKADKSLLNDVAITAEFEYQEDWESLKDEQSDSSAEDEDPNDSKAPQAAKIDKRKKRKRRRKAPENSGTSENSGNSAKAGGSASSADKDDAEGSSITRALDDFDSYLDDPGGGGQANSTDFVDEADSKDMPAPDLANGNRSNPGAWGYDQPQVSGVFSRYEEETSAEDEDFDLFDEEEGEQPRAKTLQELTSEHEKKIRRLTRQLDYQKQVLQVMAELLVEARVISRPELKRRLKDLRKKNS